MNELVQNGWQWLLLIGLVGGTLKSQLERHTRNGAVCRSRRLFGKPDSSLASGRNAEKVFLNFHHHRRYKNGIHEIEKEKRCASGSHITGSPA